MLKYSLTSYKISNFITEKTESTLLLSSEFEFIPSFYTQSKTQGVSLSWHYTLPISHLISNGDVGANLWFYAVLLKMQIKLCRRFLAHYTVFCSMLEFHFQVHESWWGPGSLSIWLQISNLHSVLYRLAPAWGEIAAKMRGPTSLCTLTRRRKYYI